jgi:hypothetical protein
MRQPIGRIEDWSELRSRMMLVKRPLFDQG